MKKLDPLVDRIAEAVARWNRFYLTALEAEVRRIRWPSDAKLFRNPGLLPRWTDSRDGYRIEYPRCAGKSGKKYVDFGGEVQLPGGGVILLDGEPEGWRCLKEIITRALQRGETLKHLVGANWGEQAVDFVAERAWVMTNRPLAEIAREEWELRNCR